mgnify:CR=1 FL=1
MNSIRNICNTKSVSKKRKYLIKILIIFILLYIIITNSLSIMIVKGTSMEPTIMQGTILVINKFGNSEKEIKVNHVYLCTIDERPSIKRVIAQGGDLVEFKQGYIYVNNIKVRKLEVIHDSSFILENDKFYMLGDNLASSVDSRMIGPIDKNSIHGQVIYALGKR